MVENMETGEKTEVKITDRVHMPTPSAESSIYRRRPLTASGWWSGESDPYE